MKIQKTYMTKTAEITRKCYVLDANNQILGRIASQAAALLRGKHKASFTPNLDTGDTVIIINADKIRVTGKKLTQKQYQRFTGYPGGQRLTKLEDLLKRRPTVVMELAVYRMLPKGPLGDKVRRKLKIYAGDKHPHQSQNPIPFAFSS